MYVDVDDGNGQYELVAVISHIGKNTDHGHYVCHVKKDNQWVLFNDDKVCSG
jgi:ubiquitin carboxyl-terminal hydrolase 5/13